MYTYDEVVEEMTELEERVRNLEKRMADMDVRYAVINTKLSAILWMLGVVGTAIIGILVKFIINI